MNGKTTIYNHRVIEQRWQKRWEEAGIYQPDLRKARNPFYNLMMFPYPSAEGLHVGNMYAFTGADIYGRFKRMQGYDVFEPIGLDGFGIHSENYAIKIGKHPTEQAKISQKRFYGQLHEIGNGFAWRNTLETYDPDYYRFTQWLFVQMFKHGLALRKKAMVNWCPSCKTVLADEQVEDGVCERCKTVTTRKETEQWFFKITEYAERLLANIDGKESQKSTPGGGQAKVPQGRARGKSQKYETFGPVPKDYDPRQYGLRWPEKIKIAQRNWIGRSEGAEIGWKVEGSSEVLWTFTTRLDTIFGATFVVIAPEHHIVASLLNLIPKTENSKLKAIKGYVEKALQKTEQKRKAAEKEKTGVDTGLSVIHPLTGEKIPIWIADFVLMGYGTGAIMGVPAHDSRDYVFARKYGLPLKVVVVSDKNVKLKTQNSKQKNKAQNDDTSGVDEGEGLLVNSAEFDGMSSQEAKEKILFELDKRGLGKHEVSYHLRDWLISRQRYWGPPIPMIFCEHCARDRRTLKGDSLKGMEGWWPVPEEELPVELPYIANYQPAGYGKSPLERAPESWLYATCPRCGQRAKRETDIIDNFVDSSWYFLRYPSVIDSQKSTPGSGQAKVKSQKYSAKLKVKEMPWEPEITKKWLPVDVYIGGAEHAVLHLLYSRFVTMALHDWGYLGFEEPFPFLFGHGLLIKEGSKMSKSKGNIVTPDEYISKFGSDTLRTYLMFLGPYDEGGDFRGMGIVGMYRFLMRVWRMFQKEIPQRSGSSHPARSVRAFGSEAQARRDDTADLKSVSAVSKIREKTDPELVGPLHRTIKKVTDDLEKLRFNTAIAALMELMNVWEDGGQLSYADAGVFLRLLAPFAPHVSEELWQDLLLKQTCIDPDCIMRKLRGKSFSKTSVHISPWPRYNDSFIALQDTEIVIQVNGRIRGRVVVSLEMTKSKEDIVDLAKKEVGVASYLEGKTIVKTVWVEGKLINFVIL